MDEQAHIVGVTHIIILVGGPLVFVGGMRVFIAGTDAGHIRLPGNDWQQSERATDDRGATDADTLREPTP